MNIIRRWAIIIIGAAVVIVGIIISPIPGPGGIPTILAGLMILGLEVALARKILLKLRKLYGAFRLWKRKNQLWWLGLVFVVICSYVTFGVFLYKKFSD